jgi:uncharacterized protein YkwD
MKPFVTLLLSTVLLACALPSVTNAATPSQVHMRRSHVRRGCRSSSSRHKRHRRRCAVASITTGAHQRSGDHHSESTATATSPAVVDPSATIGSILAAPCQSTQITPTPENVQTVREATLCLINQERARNGKLPLTVNQQLEQSAQTHSNQMVSESYFSHVSPTGETPLQRMQAADYIPSQQVGYTIGENIAWGTLSLATPQAIVAAWIASPEHLANILESKYQETGIGIDPGVPASLSEGQPGATYTQDFGVIEG